MTKEREIEAKTILPEAVYQKLVSDFTNKQVFTQVNYYFDTPNGILKANNIGCRVRVFADHAEQTLKVPDLDPVQRNFHEVIEITDQLTPENANKIVKKAQTGATCTFNGNVGQYLQQHFADEQTHLRLQTWSKTKRILADGPEGCELTLDATSYPDQYTDYELEIENTNPALIKKVLFTLENNYNFRQTSKNKNQNKIARAYMHRR
ncbi:CYTH domain-containing protein [Lactobacillus sp. ESL0791]|uniref:CYTH domain-containing protein n=1 Tax=Lactobacillus sp. ESL0791 TaxID=2983234 RepID=UPI0023F917A0|nr:CYTH domain-containing protein [Lactobacillus sp. ESL0791]MDF7638549.1 CYTH domain-containing protein [Lactobacillus sp. ESL0791]